MTEEQNKLPNRVEAGYTPIVYSLVFQALVGNGLKDTLKNAKLVDKALKGCLTSAKKIHDLVLPGWDWEIRLLDEPCQSAIATVAMPDWSWDGSPQGNTKNNPAAAWVAAILRAVEAQK